VEPEKRSEPSAKALLEADQRYFNSSVGNLSGGFVRRIPQDIFISCGPDIISLEELEDRGLVKDADGQFSESSVNRGLAWLAERIALTTLRLAGQTNARYS